MLAVLLLLAYVVHSASPAKSGASWQGKPGLVTRDSDAAVYLVTVPNSEVATNLSTGLVRSKTAACVNIVPNVRSVYMWDGELQMDEEQVLIVKSRSELLPSIAAFLKANHPYDVPELIELPIAAGSTDYLSFIRRSSSLPTLSQ